MTTCKNAIDIPITRDPQSSFPLPPPEIPHEWHIGPPDFVGIGAQKSGTTWWWKLLTNHPNVLSSHPKEVHFFDRFGRVERLSKDAYCRYFPRPTGSIVGEWTPRYMYDYWTVPMLRSIAPAAKILIILRDPFERYQSGLAHDRYRGAEMTSMLLHTHFGRSMYSHQIENVYSYYPKEQVLVLQYEQCCKDPLRQIHKTFEFLGVDPRKWSVPSWVSERALPTETSKLPLNHVTWEVLVKSFRKDILQLVKLAPELDLSLWRTYSSDSI